MIKTIKDRQYRYLQFSYREGDKIKTISEYLGPVAGVKRLADLSRKSTRTILDVGQRQEPIVAEEAMLREEKAREERYARMVESFERQTGLKIGPRDPVPIDKPMPASTASAGLSPPADSSGSQEDDRDQEANVPSSSSP